MEQWDERARMDALVRVSVRAARLAERLAATGVAPHQRTREAFLSAAAQASAAVKAVIKHSVTVDPTTLAALERVDVVLVLLHLDRVTVDPTTLAALEQDLARVRNEARALATGRAPRAEVFAALLEDARAARRETTHFFRSRPRPSEARLENQRQELLQLIEEENAKYGPVPEDVKARVQETWDGLQREFFR